MAATQKEPGTFQELRSVSMLDFFDQELRPIFCLDTHSDDSDANDDQIIQPVFQNLFLRVSGIWAKLVPPSTPVLPKTDPAWAFVQWARTTPSAEVESSRFMKYAGIHWSKTTLLERWRIITGMFCSDTVSSPIVKSEKNKLEDALQEAQKGLLRGVMDQGYRELSRTDRVNRSEERFAIDRGHVIGNPTAKDLNMHMGVEAGSTDQEEPVVDSSEGWFSQFDWSATGFGPRSSWDPQLKRITKLLLADSWPAAAYWGPRKLTIYNEQYCWLLGRKHPTSMGQPFDHVWPEVSDAFQVVFNQAVDRQVSVTSDDTEFHIERDGYLEQTYFSWSILPLFDENGQNVGFYNPIRETTIQRTLYRRMSLLLGLSQHLSTATVIAEFWPRIVDALDTGTHDVPFLLVYGAKDADNEGSAILAKYSDIRTWELKGTIGYPKNLDSLPNYIDFDDADEDLRAMVDHIQHAREPVLLSTTDGTFPARCMTTIKTRSYGEKCSHAVFCPIRPSMAAAAPAAAFVIIGVNPRRPYDEDYKLFVELLMRQLASAMAAVLLYTETLSRGKQRAESLSKQLANQEKITDNAEARFQRMADHAPVAMFKFDPNGKLEYGNEDYFHLTEVSQQDDRAFAYRQAVEEADQPIIVRQWESLAEKLEPVNNEIRLKKRWISPDGTECSTWVVAAAYPELDANGNLAGVLGCLTDISRQKWAEEVQARRTEQAIEHKRQQEMFIDMTSHELRNPLSAIIQSADGIVSTFDRPEFQTGGQISADASDISSAVDAAQTIIFCAQHQKRISDDVLVLSKLNSDLVIITPVDVRPAEVILNGLRVFDRELKKTGIQLCMHAEPSYHELEVDSVRLDPSRMLQVLINLVSNAIKFTESQNRRQIDVRFGAARAEHFHELQHIRFWDKDTKGKGLESFSNEQWGDGETIYLYMSVQDTGRGLREEEMEYLFQRFSQASPRTHIQYGGSGLGLFISKKLSEAQGGAIGASSVPGEGSTFAFYVKTRRSPPSARPQPVKPTSSDMIVIGENRQLRVDIPGIRPGSIRTGSETESKTSSRSSSTFLSPTSAGASESTTPLETKKMLQRSSSSQESESALHVLIVEDNLVNQKVLAKQLTKEGYNVSIANHGVEALDHLKRTKFWQASVQTPHTSGSELAPRPKIPRRTSSLLSAESDHLGLAPRSPVSRTSSLSPSSNTAGSQIISELENPASATEPPASEPPLHLDVVLMDIEMPIMDGITCVKRIRELQTEGKLNRVPVIAVTANAREEQIQVAKDAGMDSVVCKPFRIPELVKEIKRTLKACKSKDT